MGDGNFSLVSDISVGEAPTSVELEDLDGDGHLDLATAVNTNQVSVLWGNGQGDFIERVPEYTVNGGTLSTLGDVNGDGYLDFASIGNIADNTISILLGNDNSLFDRQSIELNVGDVGSSNPFPDSFRFSDERCFINNYIHRIQRRR